MESGSTRKVVNNSIIYTISGLFVKCFGFILLPLYTAYLTTEEYGLTGLVTSFTTTMSFVVALSLFSAVLRFYVDYNSDPLKLKRFYGTVIVFLFLSGAVWTILFTIFREPLCKYVFSGVDYYPVVIVSIISLVFECPRSVYGYILRSQQKAVRYAVCSLAYFVAHVSMAILFVVKFKLGVVGVIGATMIANVLYTLYFLIKMSVDKEIVFCLDLKLLKEALKYSIPIMPHNLSTQIALLVSKALIGGTSTMASLGLYTVATQFGNIADTVQGYVDKAYGPWLYEKLHAKADNYKTSLRKTTKALISLIGLSFLVLALFSQEVIVLFLDHAYVSSWRFVPLIIGVFSIKTIYYFYVEILFYYKEASRKLFIATLSSSLLNVVLSAVLIPMAGVYGSIMADAIAMIIRCAIVIYISRKYDDVGLKISDFIINFFIIAAFTIAGLSLSLLKFSDQFSFINLSFKVVVVLAYIGVMLLMNKEAMLSIKNMLLSKRR